MTNTPTPATPRARRWRPSMTALALALAALPFAAHAQQSANRTMTTSTAEAYSLLPGTTRGYVAATIGAPEFDTACRFGCDDPDWGFKVVTGGAWSNVVGLEVGYVNFGKADRNGGESKAHGANLSVVGNLPIGDMFNLFAKVGTTYAWTDVSASPLAAVPTGDDSGFGLSYGAGAALDLTRNWSVLAEWENHRIKFVGGRDDVSMLSLGVKYRF